MRSGNVRPYYKIKIRGERKYSKLVCLCTGKESQSKRAILRKHQLGKCTSCVASYQCMDARRHNPLYSRDKERLLYYSRAISPDIPYLRSVLFVCGFSWVGIVKTRLVFVQVAMLQFAVAFRAVKSVLLEWQQRQ